MCYIEQEDSNCLLFREQLLSSCSARHSRSKTMQQTRDIELMLGQCWTSVVDVGPTLPQHWLNVSCLLGMLFLVLGICAVAGVGHV